MPNLKIAALIVTALLGSTMMIGAAAAMPQNDLPRAGKHFTAHIHQPDHWWRGASWHRWPPHWRHRWSAARQGANDRAD